MKFLLLLFIPFSCHVFSMDADSWRRNPYDLQSNALPARSMHPVVLDQFLVERIGELEAKIIAIEENITKDRADISHNFGELNSFMQYLNDGVTFLDGIFRDMPAMREDLDMLMRDLSQLNATSEEARRIQDAFNQTQADKDDQNKKFLEELKERSSEQSTACAAIRHESVQKKDAKALIDEILAESDKKLCVLMSGPLKEIELSQTRSDKALSSLQEKVKSLENMFKNHKEVSQDRTKKLLELSVLTDENKKLSQHVLELQGSIHALEKRQSDFQNTIKEMLSNQEKQLSALERETTIKDLLKKFENFKTTQNKMKEDLDLISHQFDSIKQEREKTKASFDGRFKNLSDKIDRAKSQLDLSIKELEVLKTKPAQSKPQAAVSQAAVSEPEITATDLANANREELKEKTPKAPVAQESILDVIQNEQKAQEEPISRVSEAATSHPPKTAKEPSENRSNSILEIPSDSFTKATLTSDERLEFTNVFNECLSILATDGENRSAKSMVERLSQIDSDNGRGDYLKILTDNILTTPNSTKSNAFKLLFYILEREAYKLELFYKICQNDKIKTYFSNLDRKISILKGFINCFNNRVCDIGDLNEIHTLGQRIVKISSIAKQVQQEKKIFGEFEILKICQMDELIKKNSILQLKILYSSSKNERDWLFVPLFQKLINEITVDNILEILCLFSTFKDEFNINDKTSIFSSIKFLSINDMNEDKLLSVFEYQGSNVERLEEIAHIFNNIEDINPKSKQKIAKLINQKKKKEKK